jgi:hypothetical protein
MDRKTKLASISAVVATLLTGGVATATTMNTLTAANASGAGQVKLIDEALPAPAPGAPTIGSGVVSQPASAGVAQPGRAAATGPVAASTTGSVGSVAPVAPVAQSDSASDVDEPSPPSSAPRPEPTTPPPTSAVPPTTAPSGPNCFGSDDGMTEAQKQAREAACHGSDDD